MRTINKVLQERLIAQAEEADVQGFTKIAEHLTDKLEVTPVRDMSERYVYASTDFDKDVNAAVWDIIVRACDFHGVSIDSVEAQKIVDYYSDAVVTDFRKAANVQHGVGAYEPSLPGEVKGVVVTEVEE